jgi:heptosyltransferase-2
MGDVVMASVALHALRRAYPQARITLLAKSHAAELLAASGLVDEYLAFENGTGVPDIRRRPAREQARAMWSVLRRLRRGRFDLSIDARADLRSNVLTLLAGARHRIGLESPGGSSLLTHRVRIPIAETHKIDDWLALLRPLGIDDDQHRPELAVTADEEDWAAGVLAAQGIEPGDVVVGIHPGASQPTRRWDLDRFGEVSDRIASRFGVKTLLFLSPDGYGASLAPRDHAVRVQPRLREMMALIAKCQLFVANDSGPAHIAAALGVPTVTIFTAGKPEWWAPRGMDHQFVIKAELSCRPCFDRCIFSERYCNTTLSVDEVLLAVESRLERLAVHD